MLRAIQFVCGSVSYRHYLKFLCPVVRGTLLLCTYFIFLSIVVCRALSVVVCRALSIVVCRALSFVVCRALSFVVCRALSFA